MKEITHLFQTTNSKLVKSILDSGGAVMGIKAEGFAGVLLEDQSFATELQKKVEEAGARGFVSTDELPKYGLSRDEKIAIEKEFEAGEKDVVVFVAAPKEEATRAIEVIEEEIKKKKG